MGDIAALGTAVLGAAAAVIGSLQRRGPEPSRVPEAGRTRNIIDITALALAHACIFLLGWLALFADFPAGVRGCSPVPPGRGHHRRDHGSRQCLHRVPVGGHHERLPARRAPGRLPRRRRTHEHAHRRGPPVVAGTPQCPRDELGCLRGGFQRHTDRGRRRGHHPGRILDEDARIGGKYRVLAPSGATAGRRHRPYRRSPRLCGPVPRR